MVRVIIRYRHRRKQWLWRGKGASGPAGWYQAGLTALLGWLASEHVLQLEEIKARSPLRSATMRAPPSAG
jgi:hypothetical protein